MYIFFFCKLYHAQCSYNLGILSWLLIINPFCSYTPTAVSRHFLISGHAEDHMILIPLEQLHTSRDSIRKAREAFLIHRGKTLEPAGLNRRDEM